MFDNLKDGEQEKVFIYMIGKLFNPWIGGILLAAILSAIMSTIDSQLLVSSSALSQDVYLKSMRKGASEEKVIWVGRGCVIVTFLVALVIALICDSTVLDIVAFAWAGLGAAFGPLVLFALFSRKTSWQSALAGMTIGTAVLVAWKLAGLGDRMYEIVPGFAANCLTILALNLLIGQKDERVLQEFDDVINEIRST
jgi:sodium/proline symporter